MNHLTLHFTSAYGQYKCSLGSVQMPHVGIQDTMSYIPVGLANMAQYLQGGCDYRQSTKGLVKVSKGTLEHPRGH